jgi:hypothetical protein
VPDITAVEVGDEQHRFDEAGGGILDPAPEAVDAVTLVDDRERGAAGPALQELRGVMNALMPREMCGAGAGRCERAEREEG